MLMKVMTRWTSSLLVQQVVVGLFLPKVTETVGLISSRETSQNRSMQALSIGMRGNVYPYGMEESFVQDPVVVRREVATHHAELGAAGASRTHGEGLLEIEESTGSVKIVIVCLASFAALMSFCALAVWLVWQPMNAIFEERAYEQAAKSALLDAAPKPIVVQAEGATEPLAQSAEQQQEENVINREEQINLAWKKFLDNPLLQISRSNLLARVLREVLDTASFSDQAEELFKGLDKMEGTDSEFRGTITRDDVERVVEGISGSLFNMRVKDRIAHVDFCREGDCSLAVAEKEDYDWLYHSYDEVFPTHLPLDAGCFEGLLKLIIVWNCVRTLHTARHMRQELSAEHHTASKDATSNKVALTIKVDARAGFVLEAKGELVVEDVAEEKKGNEEVAEAKGGGDLSAAAPSASASPPGQPIFQGEPPAEEEAAP